MLEPSNSPAADLLSGLRGPRVAICQIFEVGRLALINGLGVYPSIVVDVSRTSRE